MCKTKHILRCGIYTFICRKDNLQPPHNAKGWGCDSVDRCACPTCMKLLAWASVPLKPGMVLGITQHFEVGDSKFQGHSQLHKSSSFQTKKWGGENKNERTNAHTEKGSLCLNKWKQGCRLENIPRTAAVDVLKWRESPRVIETLGRVIWINNME